MDVEEAKQKLPCYGEMVTEAQQEEVVIEWKALGDV